jgi:glycosyltransferase involved in cell wall biosynthesis
LYTPHGYHFHPYGKPLSNKIYRTIETHAGQNWSDAVLTVNNDDYFAAINHGVVPAEKLYWTRGQGITLDIFDENRVSDEARQAVRTEFGADGPNALVVTYIAEFIPRKRHSDALEAFAKIQTKYPEAVLVFAGKGPLWEQTKQQAAQRGIAEQTRFLGFRRDIPVVLAATDVLLFPSEQEGLPCAIQEAFGMAVPVVASDIRGNRDLIDPTCGRLAPLGDVNALAVALNDVLSLPEPARKALGQAGREKMLREFNSARCVAEWQGVYVRLLEEHGLPVPPGLRKRAATPPLVPPTVGVKGDNLSALLFGAKGETTQ